MEYKNSIGDKLIIKTKDGVTSVRISPTNNLKSKEIIIPYGELQVMVNMQ